MIVFALLATVTATYAYWASSINGNSDTATGTVTIGEGGVAETVVTVSDETLGTALVPDTQPGTNNVDLVFTVNWAEDSLAQLNGSIVTGTLTATAVFTRIDNNSDADTLLDATEIGAMFTLGEPVYQGDNQTITMGTAKSVTINLLFDNEPASKEIYDKIVKGKIIITVTFTVTNPNAA